MIPQSFINGLLERVDPVDVIGKRVQLRKAGDRHTGLCPFHDEKTPSFHVYPDHYHCFGCGAHGTVLGFLMEREGLAFPEAVEELAGLLGLEVPRESGRAPRADPAAFDVLAAADKCYRKWLREHPEGPAAIDYLRGRGISDEIVRDFGIGLAPSGWRALKTELQAFGEERLLAAGLLAGDAGKTYDRFRHRIVFPIRDRRGRVIGFGGRVYAEDAGSGEPKYLNSPETDVFKKGRELYGLYEARRGGRLESAVLVEGYMDVVALAQHGVANAVATLGTAVGEAHFDSLYRFVNRVVCCFDGDDAGARAATRAVDAAFPALSERRELRFAFLERGEDPDTVVRRHGAKRFQALLETATPVGEHFLAQMQTGLRLADADGRALLIELAVPRLAKLPAGELRAALIDELARRGQTAAARIERRLQDHRQAGEAPPAERAPPPPLQSRLAQRLLAHLVKCPRALGDLAGDEAERLELAARETLLGEVVSYVDATPDADTATLLGRFSGDDAHAQLLAAAGDPALLDEAALRAEFVAGARRFLAESERQARRALLDAARESGSRDDLRKLVAAKGLHPQPAAHT